ncbi:MAG TPA: hypothetical protein VGH19_07065 [Verrucomicrobiae bacterium]
MLDDFGILQKLPTAPIRAPTSSLTRLYRQRVVSTENIIKNPQENHLFSLKFAAKTQPFLSQEHPKIPICVTRIPFPLVSPLPLYYLSPIT